MWSSWESLPPCPSSVLDFSATGPHGTAGHVDLVVRGSDRALYATGGDGPPATPSAWSPWQRLGGKLGSAPCVVSWGGDRADVFALGASGAIAHCYREGSQWNVFPNGSHWQQSGLPPEPLDLGRGLTAAAPSVDTVHLFGLDADHHAKYMYWRHGWGPVSGGRAHWQSIGDSHVFASTPVPVAPYPNRIDVFGITTAGRVAHSYRVGDDAWTAWQNLADVSLKAPLTAVSWGPGRVDLCARASSNEDVVHLYWDDELDGWGPRRADGTIFWESFGFPGAEAGSWRHTTSAVPGPDAFDVFGLGEQRAVYARSFRPGLHPDWTKLNPPIGPPRVADDLVAVTADGGHVVLVASDLEEPLRLLACVES